MKLARLTKRGSLTEHKYVKVEGRTAMEVYKETEKYRKDNKYFLTGLIDSENVFGEYEKKIIEKYKRGGLI